jgi:hypothetical protein
MQAVIDAALIAAWHQPVRPDTGNVTDEPLSLQAASAHGD